MLDGLHTPTALSRIYYPPPPWVLYGSALVASFRIDPEGIAALVPPPLTLARIRNLAMGYLAVWQYGPGSTLEYNELIAGTFVRYGSRFGLYVSHIGVDNDVSQRAGRELWYLPKHRWHFEWQHDELATSVRVWDGSRLVCAISDAPVKAAFWPLRTSVTFLNLRGTDVATITGKFNLGVAAIPWQFQPGPDGPLTLFKPIGRVFTFALKGTAEVQSLQVLDAGATNA